MRFLSVIFFVSRVHACTRAERERDFEFLNLVFLFVLIALLALVFSLRALRGCVLKFTLITGF